MRGIEPHSELIRRLRKARRLTQAELAVVAGVSERTVRNAETGRRVQVEFLGYLATALGAELEDFVREGAELRAATRQQQRIGLIREAVDAYAVRDDFWPLRRLLSPKATIRIVAPAEVPFAGEFCGYEGLKRLFDLSREYVHYLEAPKVAEIRASGNFVILNGTDRFRVIGTSRYYEGWWQHIYEYEKGQIVRADVTADWRMVARVFAS
jgi:transcriptional regulator with XRE-family HTH domain